MFGFGVVVAAASCDLELTIGQTGLLVGSPFTGLLFAYLWGYYADTRGRRRALLLSTSAGFIFGALTSFAVNWEMMLITKIICSSFSIASHTLTITYLGESTRIQNRSQYIFIMNSMNLGAEVISFGLAYFILPLTFAYPLFSLPIIYNSWRLYTFILATPLGIGALLLCCLYESPKFLAGKRGDEAIDILRKIFLFNGGDETAFPVKSFHLTSDVQSKSFCGSLTTQASPLFTPPLLWRTIQLFFLLALACSINNAFIMWFPTMVDMFFHSMASGDNIGFSFCDSIRNATVSQNVVEKSCSGVISEETLYSGVFASLFFAVLNLVVAMFATWRRLVLISAFFVSAASCLAVVLQNHPIASVLFYALIQTSAIGLGSVSSFFVDIYPTTCSGLATSLGFMFARFASLTSVTVIGATIVGYCNGRYNYLALFACSVICIAVSLDIFGFSVVVDAAACDLELTIQQVGLLVSSPLVGILFAYPWGYLADTQGRRLAILISTSVGFVFSALSSFAVNWQMMLAAKVVGSSFSLSSLTLIMTYLGESVVSKHRNEYLFLMNSVNLGAEMVTFGLALLLLPLPIALYIPWLSIKFVSWRLYTLVISLPMGIGALLMMRLQESPKFLFSKGKEDKALQVLRKIFVANGGKKSQYPVKSLKKVNCYKIRSSFCGSLARQTVPVFTPPLLWRTLQLFYLVILVTAINNICLMWFPTMLDLVFNSDASVTVSGTFCESLVKNVTRSRPLQNICEEPVSTKTLTAGLLTSMFFGLLNLSVSKLAVWRRCVLMSAYLISAISCVMVTVLKQPIASVIFFALIQIVGLGIGCLASYFNDIYPTSCRSLATNLGFMVARSMALVGIIVIGDVVVDHCNLIFYTAGVAFLSGIVTALFLPSDKRLND
ncbi:uncharacterized protein LOC119839447 [Zerene cesonia]|uniref:uncharacterized protein LOC119839447 n=1 Tax=Zerene cesonia TaxID=33412 RepID=UPI0018E573B8|nr:uncharacterized protein LOC119839447 [Zerene cesonia]